MVAALLLAPPANAFDVDFGNLAVVGDSITHGGGGYASYRYDLFKHLQNNGAGYTFVGSNTGFYNSGTASTPAVGGVAFSNVHEGHWSWRSYWMNGRVPLPTTYTANGRGGGTIETWTGQASQYSLDTAGNLVNYTGTTYAPDSVVIMIGINDLNAGSSSSQLRSDVQSMVQQYQAAGAHDIYVTSVLPVGTGHSNYATLSTRVPEYNGLLAAAARGWSTATSSVRYLDVSTGFSAATMTYDNLHPNVAGEQHVANRLASMLFASQGVYDQESINVRNHSFEDPSGNTIGSAASVAGWTFAAFGTGTSAGSFSPQNTSTGLYYSSPTGVAGNRVAFMLRGTEFGYAEQQLLGSDGVAGGGNDAVLAPNSLYTATVAIGRRNGTDTSAFAGYQATMFSGTHTVATKTMAGGAKGSAEEQAIGAAGAFTDHTMTFTTGDVPTGFGEQLKFRIGRNDQAGSTGRYLDFDNVRITVMSDVYAWNASGTAAVWGKGANWSGAVPGATGTAAAPSNHVAYFTGVSAAVAASGVGIDMAASGGAANIGAVWLASGSGTVRIGNSSATSGVLRLDGRTIDGVADTVIAVAGSGDLVLADTPSGSGAQRMDVVLGGTVNAVRVAAGRTVTIRADIGEAAAGAAVTLSGGGTLVVSGSNAYGGGTRVVAGVLAAHDDDALGTGEVTLAGGGLRLGNGVVLGNDVVLASPAAATTLDGAVLVDYLVVGGGGGGGGSNGGGGGGGGMLEGSSTLSQASNSVVVGAGGLGGFGYNGAANANMHGNKGSDSSAFGVTAAGGGGGGSYGSTIDTAKGVGGSGGGGGSYNSSNTAGYAATSGAQGSGGGIGVVRGSPFSVEAGGGGGGAGGAGSPATGASSDGGAGRISTITGSAVYYAGGGGGGSDTRGANRSGDGGLGGGGDGSHGTGGATAGADGLGGGGGGSGYSGALNARTGGSGGSGVVIVRYSGSAVATGGTVDSVSVPGYTLHTFSAGSHTLAFDASSVTATIAGRISGTGGFTWSSAGLLTLSGNNTYSGGTVVASGRVAAGHASAFGSGSITLSSGAVLDLAGFAVSNTIVNVGGAILNAGGYQGSQTVSGSSTFSGDTGGTIAVGNGAMADFTGEVVGTVTMTGGTATFGGPITGVVAVTGGVATVMGNVATTADVSVGAGGTLRLGAGAAFGKPALVNHGVFAVTGASGTVALSTAISGSGSFTKTGGGATTLSGSSSYTGGTTVFAGRLTAANVRALGSGSVSVTSGATLAIAGVDLDLGANAVHLAEGSWLEMTDGASVQLSAGSALSGVSTISPTQTTAAILGGTSSGGTLSTAWLPNPGTGTTYSAVLELTTPTSVSEPFVLSMSYGDGVIDDELFLGWLDETSGVWVNAVNGNVVVAGISAASGTQLGYLGSFTAFQTEFGTDLTDYVGAYGRDAEANTVWAVVNHNSEFVVLLVPEPGTFALAAVGLAVAVVLRLRRRAPTCAPQFGTLVIIVITTMAGAVNAVGDTLDSGVTGAYSAIINFDRVDYYPQSSNPTGTAPLDRIAALQDVFVFKATTNSSGGLTLPSGSGFAANLDYMRSGLAPGTRVSLSMGTLNPLVDSSTALNTFLGNLDTAITTHDITGIDLDWEDTPLSGDPSAPTDAEYVRVVKAISDRFRPRGVVLSVGHSSWIGAYAPRDADVAPYVDYFNIQFYFGMANAMNTAAMADKLASFVDAGTPAAKIRIGLPIYGATAGETQDILWKQLVANGANVQSGTSWTADGATYYYSGLDLLEEKIAYAKSNGFAGVFTWNLACDVDYSSSLSALRTIDNAALGSVPTLELNNSNAGAGALGTGIVTLGSGAVLNNGLLRLNRSGTATYGNRIDGTGSVRVSAPAAGTTVILTGANKYSGGTVVDAGATLRGGAGGTAGSITGPVTNAGKLVFDRSNSLTYSGVISGTGSVTKDGAGTLTLTGSSTFSGGTIVADGTLAFGAGGSTKASAPITVQNGATLRFDRSDTWGAHSTTTSAAVTVAAGGKVQSNGRFNTLVNPTLGGGTLELTGGASASFPAFALKGTVTVNGTQASAITAVSGANNAVAIGTTAAAGSTTFNVANVTGNTSADLTVSAELQDARNDANTADLASGLVKTGAGRMVLSASSSYSGATAVNAGTLTASAPSALGRGTVTVAAGATLQIGNAAGVQLNTLTALAGSTVSFTAAAGSTYTIGAISGPASLNASGSRLVVGGNDASTFLSGTIAALSLTKTGAGTLTLSASNAIGGVTVSGGAIHAATHAALGSGTVTLSGGGIVLQSAAPATQRFVLVGGAAANSIGMGVAVDYLVVGGGGAGGGRDAAGGGGGGGVLTNLVGGNPTPTTLAPGSYAVTVGAGGVGAADTDGGSGENSTFAALTAVGGGGGGYYSRNGKTGGSGGGSGRDGTSGAAGTTGQGRAGGSGSTANSGAGGGGGGAGGAGEAGATTASGDGGAGLAVPILSTADATSLHVGHVSGGSVYFGGGGGGTGHRTTSATVSSGSGGLGGGGAGATSYVVNPTDGAANSGGGGGASRSAPGYLSSPAAAYTGGDGGSGVVIVRYRGSPADGIATGGQVTAGTGTSAGYTLHTFTSVGSASLVVNATRTISGTISGAGGFTFDTPNATLVLSGNNSYSGGTIVGGGTVEAASATALGTGRIVTRAGGTLAITASGTRTYAFPSVAGSGTIAAGANTLAVGDASSTIYSGGIAAAALVKQGAGQLALSGTNDIGAMTIAAGALLAGSGRAFGSGAVTLAGGELRLADGVDLPNAVVLSTVAGATTIGGPTLDYLVVAGGGGGGGRDSSGGGGGGGVLSNVIGRGGVLPAAGSYAIAVGGGGAGGANMDGNGANGEASSLGAITAEGGGGGGRYYTAGSAGGSGGGGGRQDAPQGGAGTAGPPLQGFAGGAGSGGSDAAVDAGGGGGGAGSAGGNAVAGSRGGAGGVGVAVSILTAAEAVALGVGDVSGGEVFFGGGGGGTPHRTATSIPAGAGGAGGGGDGASAEAAPNPGAANTGGGGGASRSATAGLFQGGAGGSGVVIVRYAGGPLATGGTVLAGSGENAGATLHVFTGPGEHRLSFRNATATISGNVSGTGGFTWDSPGSLTLSGSNTYSGGTIVSAGTVAAGSRTAFGTGTVTLAGGALDLGGFAVANTIVASGGRLVIGSGGEGRLGGRVGGRVEVAAGGSAEFDDTASVGDSAEFVTDGVLLANRATSLTIGRPIGGAGSFRKRGVGRVVLSGSNTYSGGTQVEAGALVVNGSIQGGVDVASGARLGGSGRVGGRVGGTGVVAPGNSPGIMSVGSIDPMESLSFEFEITGSAPDWASASASVNDVLRITDGSPFTQAMTSGNAIDVLFGLPGASPVAAGTYTGGFLVDGTSDFTSLVSAATFSYWVAGEFGALGDRRQFNTGGGGALRWYTRLAVYDPSLSVQWLVSPVTADFGGGSVTGSSLQFMVVPEPGAVALAVAGLSLAAVCRRRRVGRPPPAHVAVGRERVRPDHEVLNALVAQGAQHLDEMRIHPAAPPSTPRHSSWLPRRARCAATA